MDILINQEFINKHDDVHVLTLWDDVSIDNTKVAVSVGDESSLNTFAVTDSDGNVYMLAREVVDERLAINEETTAIALITMHPLFGMALKEDYSQLKSMIKASRYYDAYFAEVKKLVKEGKPLYADDNSALLVAISNLLEDLCGRQEGEGEYDGELGDVEEESSLQSGYVITKSIYEHPQINPTYIDAHINGNVLMLRTIWVTPSYYGTITLPGGGHVSSVIESRDDFGGMDLFFNRSTYGSPMEFAFGEFGNYKFSYSRTTLEARIDFYKRLAGSVLTIIGLDIKFAERYTLADAVAEALLNTIVSTETNFILNGGSSVLDVLGMVVDATVSVIESGKTSLSMKAVNFCKVLSSGMNWYDKIKGTANTALRLGFAFDAPENINFCTCYSENEVKTCSIASLTKLSGDEQTGYKGQRLLLPLKVYVETLGEDDNYYMPMGYNKVKFEVVSGGGSVEYDVVSTDLNSEASTYWTLGESGEQTVKVTVLDVVTDKEISEPVYFTASLETASITIRLDWSKHSGKTDIDLHVVDPFGERIMFSHMTSVSGGYLDRDDVIGPGPEHVRWIDAPAGTYKIYVHYYPNGEEDRSVTSYRVTVNAGGVEYRPKTGSISYDQIVPVGQFTIGEPQQSMSRAMLFDTEAVEFDIPEKN